MVRACSSQGATLLHPIFEVPEFSNFEKDIIPASVFNSSEAIVPQDYKIVPFSTLGHENYDPSERKVGTFETIVDRDTGRAWFCYNQFLANGFSLRTLSQEISVVPNFAANIFTTLAFSDEVQELVPYEGADPTVLWAISRSYLITELFLKEFSSILSGPNVNDPQCRTITGSGLLFSADTASSSAGNKKVWGDGSYYRPEARSRISATTPGLSAKDATALDVHIETDSYNLLNVYVCAANVFHRNHSKYPETIEDYEHYVTIVAAILATHGLLRDRFPDYGANSDPGRRSCPIHAGERTLSLGVPLTYAFLGGQPRILEQIVEGAGAIKQFVESVGLPAVAIDSHPSILSTPVIGAMMIPDYQGSPFVSTMPARKSEDNHIAAAIYYCSGYLPSGTLFHKGEDPKPAFAEPKFNEPFEAGEAEVVDRVWFSLEPDRFITVAHPLMLCAGTAMYHYKGDLAYFLGEMLPNWVASIIRAAVMPGRISGITSIDTRGASDFESRKRAFSEAMVNVLLGDQKFTLPTSSLESIADPNKWEDSGVLGLFTHEAISRMQHTIDRAQTLLDRQAQDGHDVDSQDISLATSPDVDIKTEGYISAQIHKDASGSNICVAFRLGNILNPMYVSSNPWNTPNFYTDGHSPVLYAGMFSVVALSFSGVRRIQMGLRRDYFLPYLRPPVELINSVGIARDVSAVGYYTGHPHDSSVTRYHFGARDTRNSGVHVDTFGFPNMSLPSSITNPDGTCRSFSQALNLGGCFGAWESAARRYHNYAGGPLAGIRRMLVDIVPTLNSYTPRDGYGKRGPEECVHITAQSSLTISRSMERILYREWSQPR